MRIFLTILLVATSLGQLFGQESDPKIDSLKNIINGEAHDTLKIQALFSYQKLIGKKNPEEKVKALKSIVDIAQKARNDQNPYELNRRYKTSEGSALGRLGLHYRLARKYDLAIETLHKSIALKSEAGDSISVANSLFSIAACYYRKRDYKTTLKYLDESMAVSEAVNDTIGIAYSANVYGLVKKTEGNFEEALKWYTLSYKYRVITGNYASTSTPLNNMGSIYDDLGDYNRALECYEKAIEMRKKANKSGGTAITYNRLGLVYHHQGNYEKAVEYYEISRAKYLEEGDSIHVRHPMNGMGNSYRRMGKRTEALKMYAECIRLALLHDDSSSLATYYVNQGLIYQDFNHDKAIEFYEKGLELGKDLGNKELTSAGYSNMANVYYMSDEYDKAEQLAKKALKISRESKIKNSIETSLGSCYAAAMGQENYSESHGYITELLDLQKQEMELNFPLLSEREKELYFLTIREDFEIFNDFVFKHHDQHPELVGDAYNNTLLVKGMLLKSSTALRSTILNSNDSMIIAKYDEWIEVKSQVADQFAQGEDIDELEKKANLLEKELVKLSHDFLGYKKAISSSWKDVQSELQHDEAAIEFLRFDYQIKHGIDSLVTPTYAALIVTKDCEYPKFVELFSESELNKIIGDFPGNNLSYIEQIYGTEKNTKTQLYDLIWSPIETKLDGAKTIYLSPDGLLHKISFSAIADSKGVYLCDNYEINVQGSTSLVGHSARSDMETISHVGVFGGIDYNSTNTQSEIWKYLDGSEQEVERIKKILSGDIAEVEFYHHADATEGQFKETAQKSQLLHIATHGFFYVDPDLVREQNIDEEESTADLVFRGHGRKGFALETFVRNKNPLMRSGLVFAGANNVWSTERSIDDDESGEDGVLTAQEVALLDMRNTELVVLSACETGLGDIKGSEGVYGLQRAFKMAGVKYLIMSLWQVPDEETAEFMTTFYKNLTKSREIKKAFHQTQQEMRKKYDPYYWAAFVLVE